MRLTVGTLKAQTSEKARQGMRGYCRTQPSAGGSSQRKQSGARGREAGGYLKDLVCVGGDDGRETDMTAVSSCCRCMYVCVGAGVYVSVGACSAECVIVGPHILNDTMRVSCQFIYLCLLLTYLPTKCS